ncbi:MAG: hypothetical protein OXG24_13575 [Gammaproteobacteria bacterium]|nr:hypothetical protein [Gammaproteobacteria bacterium]
MNQSISGRPFVLLSLGGFGGAAIVAVVYFCCGLIGSPTIPSDNESTDNVKSRISSNPKVDIDLPRNQNMEPNSVGSIESLKDLERLNSQFERSLSLHKLVSRADEASLINLIDDSLAIEQQSMRRLVLSTVFRKLATINPENAVSAIEKLSRFDIEPMLSVVFEEWSLIDLEGAIEGLKVQPGSKGEAALTGLLQARDDLSDQAIREIGRRAGNEKLAIDLISQSRVQKAISHPELAWQSLISDDSSDNEQVALFTRVAEMWIQNDGMSVLEEINSSLTDWRLTIQVLRPLLNQLVESDAQEAFDFALSLSTDTDSRLVSILVDQWASHQPDRAYDAVNSVEPFYLQTSLRERVLYRWATDRPHDVLKRLDSFPIESRDTARNAAIVSIAQDSPEEAAQLFAQLEAGSNRIGIAQTIISLWSKKDTKRALEWIISNPQMVDVQHRMFGVALRILARENPQQALEMALDLPIQEGKLGLEANVVRTVAQHDISQAQTMLPKVRDGFTRYTAYEYVGIALVKDGDSHRALKLANDLSESSKSSYLATVVGYWASSSPLTLYDSLSQLPSANIQSQAAFRIINNNLSRRVLSDDQIKNAESFLSDAAQQRLESWRKANRSQGGSNSEAVIRLPMSPLVITR